MAPFCYNSERKFVYLSSVSTIRSLCTSVLVVGVSLFCDVLLWKGYVAHQGKAVEYVVGYILFHYNLIKMFIHLHIQLIHRDDLVVLLNQILSVKSNFEQFVHIEKFEDKRFLNHSRKRKILAGIQFVALISSISIYVSRSLCLNYFLVIFCYFAVVYINLFSTLATGIYYNGSMIFVDRFYRILISRMRFLLLVVKSEKVMLSLLIKRKLNEGM